jgi:hypothetical protein
MEVIGVLIEVVKDYDKVYLCMIVENEAKFASIFTVN